MAFLKRLGFYMFGLAIGLIFLTIFLKKKSEETGVYFCYLPNCRTLKDMRSKPIEFSDRINEMIANKELDTLSIQQIFTDGDVDFSASDTKAEPCKIYLIEGEIDDDQVTMEVKNCEDRVVVVGLR